MPPRARFAADWRPYEPPGAKAGPGACDHGQPLPGAPDPHAEAYRQRALAWYTLSQHYHMPHVQVVVGGKGCSCRQALIGAPGVSVGACWRGAR